MSCVHFFQRLEINDVERVGGKNASLGEMYLHLSAGALKCRMVLPLHLRLTFITCSIIILSIK